MNSFFGWVGGKMRLREIIVDCFPPSFLKYIEVFGGAAWVLFHKEPGRFEVYNDLNSNLVNLYRCVREDANALVEELRYSLNSREEFFRILAMFRDDVYMPPVQQAANYYLLIRHSYAASVDSFSCQPHDIWRDFPTILAAHERLRRVIIENRDFESLIKVYDGPGSFFYCDPPYYGTEAMYSFVDFSRESHENLRDTLLAMEGVFLLSYNDCPEVREMYNRPGIYIKEVERLNNLAQRYDGGSQYKELLIANYDMDERSRLQKQFCLFDKAG